MYKQCKKKHSFTYFFSHKLILANVEYVPVVERRPLVTEEDVDVLDEAKAATSTTSSRSHEPSLTGEESTTADEVDTDSPLTSVQSSPERPKKTVFDFSDAAVKNAKDHKAAGSVLPSPQSTKAPSSGEFSSPQSASPSPAETDSAEDAWQPVVRGRTKRLGGGCSFLGAGGRGS